MTAIIEYLNACMRTFFMATIGLALILLGVAMGWVFIMIVTAFLH